MPTSAQIQLAHVTWPFKGLKYEYKEMDFMKKSMLIGQTLNMNKARGEENTPTVSYLHIEFDRLSIVQELGPELEARTEPREILE